jgi:hypothetical protein
MMYNKVEMPNLVTYLNPILIIEWDVVWCGSKNGYQKDMSWKEIGLRAKNVIILLSSVVNTIEVTIWSFDEYESVHFDHE